MPKSHRFTYAQPQLRDQRLHDLRRLLVAAGGEQGGAQPAGGGDLDRGIVGALDRFVQRRGHPLKGVLGALALGKADEQLTGGSANAANLRDGAGGRLAAGSAAVVGNEVGVGQDGADGLWRDAQLFRQGLRHRRRTTPA